MPALLPRGDLSDRLAKSSVTGAQASTCSLPVRGAGEATDRDAGMAEPDGVDTTFAGRVRPTKRGPMSVRLPPASGHTLAARRVNQCDLLETEPDDPGDDIGPRLAAFEGESAGNPRRRRER